MRRDQLDALAGAAGMTAAGVMRVRVVRREDMDAPWRAYVIGEPWWGVGRFTPWLATGATRDEAIEKLRQQIQGYLLSDTEADEVMVRLDREWTGE